MRELRSTNVSGILKNNGYEMEVLCTAQCKTVSVAHFGWFTRPSESLLVLRLNNLTEPVRTSEKQADNRIHVLCF